MKDGRSKRKSMICREKTIDRKKKNEEGEIERSREGGREKEIKREV